MKKQDKDDLFDEFEGWEVDYYLLNNKQYDKLITLREQNLEKTPDDIHLILELSEAYCLNREYLKALKILEKIYREGVDDFTVGCMILETIWVLGKDEKEFDWYEAPRIFNLDEQVSNYCFEFLKGKRKAVPIYSLYLSFYGVGYTKFDEAQLYELLTKDPRFLIEEEGDPMMATVKRKPIR